jgi:hypothetical protein
MLNIKLCKKILNKNSKNYNDEEVERIRDFIIMFAEIHSRNLKINCYEEESCNIHKGLNG